MQEDSIHKHRLSLLLPCFERDANYAKIKRILSVQRGKSLKNPLLEKEGQDKITNASKQIHYCFTCAVHVCHPKLL